MCCSYNQIMVSHNGIMLLNWLPIVIYETKYVHLKWQKIKSLRFYSVFFFCLFVRLVVLFCFVLFLSAVYTDFVLYVY